MQQVARLVLVLVALAGPACMDPPAAAAAHESPAPAAAQPTEARAVELSQAPPRQWFPPLDELLADPEHNPLGASLAPDAAKLATEAFLQAGAELQAIEDGFGRRQAELARALVESGDAEPYVPGVSDTRLHDSAAVVVGSVDGSPEAYVVRLSHAQLPEARTARAEIEAIREHAFFVLQSLLSERVAGAGEPPP